jgi:hypothetical protein
MKRTGLPGKLKYVKEYAAKTAKRILKLEPIPETMRELNMKRSNGTIRNTIRKFSRLKKDSGKSRGGKTDISDLALKATAIQ